MRNLQRMLGISWVDQLPNKDILQRVNSIVDRELFEDVKRRETSYLGHILCLERFHFQRFIIQGKIEGGKNRNSYKKIILPTKYITKNTNTKLPELQNAAINKTLWREWWWMPTQESAWYITKEVRFTWDV